MPDAVVVTEDLKKYFPSRNGPVKAVDGVNLEVFPGEIFGFLGPNGAGKTTTLRILTTLVKADSGAATIAGFDVLREPGDVRRNIGYVGQAGGADRPATGRENLILQGRLYDMTLQQAKERAAELIAALDLTEFADRIAHTYSGGQLRRLDVALGIMHRPKVLFLDEPTTGLDPQNRANLWIQIGKLRDMGVTVFLTTHYLEEADTLSDRLAIMDHGKIVAEGTPTALKKLVAGDTISVGLMDDRKNAAIAALLAQKPYVRDFTVDDCHLRIVVEEGSKVMPELLRLFDQESIEVATITLAVPTLDDVFLKQTGRTLRDTESAGGEQG
jgi:ABC-2 type transport system ATP-binding protein